jgi:hypothetical protein
MAETMTGFRGTVEALPLDPIRALIASNPGISRL